MKAPMRLLVLCAALLAGRAQGAADAEGQLLARLHQPAVLRGDIVQTRLVAGFKRSVESRGDFVMERGEGLLWHTRQPFDSLLPISRDRLPVTQGAGSATTLDARREPMLRALNEILQGVVVADIAALKKRFDLSIRLVGEADWELVLQPKDAALRARFTAIRLGGSTHVQQVRLSEANGDVTDLRFENQREDAQLSPAETGNLQ